MANRKGEAHLDVRQRQVCFDFFRMDQGKHPIDLPEGVDQEKDDANGGYSQAF